ncbi:MAG: twin-arginine translocase TatA/TatE family subunit [Deltaproteobacteria bacterium]|nr:twin-arginine translocase TatA/TatE family subunit [Deltaproteobacteria bacterium]
MGIGGLGPWELILVFLIVLIVFGAGKLPSIGSSLGQAIKNFKGSLKGKDEKENKEPKNG